MFKTQIFFTIFFTLVGLCSSQVNTFNEQYLHSFDGSSRETNSIAQANNRDYFICRGINSASVSIYELLRVDREGKPLWSKQLSKGISTSTLATFNSLLRTSDGANFLATSLLVGGEPQNGIIIKTDSNANIIWSKQFTGDGTLLIMGLKQVSDKGFIACGLTRSASIHHPYIFKLDSMGNFIWGKKCSNGMDSSGAFLSVTEIPGNNYVACGYTGKTQIYTRWDANGNLIWDKLVKNTRGTLNTCIATVDNAVLMGGYFTDTTIARSRLMLVKSDFNGNMIWQRGYTQTPGIYYGSNMLCLHQGNTGRITYSAYMMDPIPGAFIGKLDLNGNILWNTKNRFTFTSFSDILSTIINAKDGGLAFTSLVGTITGTMSTYSTEFLKTDSLGSVGCEGITYPLSLSGLSFSVSSGVVASNSGTGSNYTPNIVTTVFTNTMICENIQDSASTTGVRELAQNKFEIYPNVPNPFSDQTKITYVLNSDAKKINFGVYDILGNKVFESTDLPKQAGTNDFYFVNKNLVSGVYLYKLEVDGKTAFRKMVIE